MGGGLNELFSRFGGRRSSADGAAGVSAARTPELSYPTKALPKFLTTMAAKQAPALLDLGSVVGTNVSFFGEELGCRIRVEDIMADIERHAATGTLDALPAFFRTRFKSEPGTIDGILCWDVFDYLERPAAESLAASLTRLLNVEGSLLGFFSTATDPGRAHYTKYIVVDQGTLRYRPYPGTRVRQRSLQNRDIIKLFESLRISDSFLMKTNVREIIFRKPAYLAGL
ncbi:MAG: hypothetical protein R2745_20125 [Vicinamibacterales bacterium]